MRLGLKLGVKLELKLGVGLGLGLSESLLSLIQRAPSRLALPFLKPFEFSSSVQFSS